MQVTSAAIIVAAGASHRMQGRNKLWLPLAGRITLARTIEDSLRPRADQEPVPSDPEGGEAR